MNDILIKPCGVLGISWGSRAARELEGELRGISGLARAAERVVVAPMEEPGTHRQFLDEAPRVELAAIVLLVDDDGLKHEAFRDTVKWCAEQVGKREEFRLYVCLRGVDLTDERLSDLNEAVQIAEGTDNISWHEDLLRHLSRYPEIRKVVTFRQMRDAATTAAGVLAQGFQYLAAAATLAFGTVALWDLKLALSLPVSWRIAGAVVSGAIYFPLLSIVVFHMSHFAELSQFRSNSNRFRVQAYAAAFFGPWSVGVPVRIHAPVPWLMLGIASGVLIDMIRRAGLQARRARARVDPSQLTDCMGERREGRQKQLATMGVGRVPDPLTAPIFPNFATLRVFISYSRGSHGFGVPLATELHHRLESLGIQCFLDRESIRTGSAWRTELSPDPRTKLP